jgi:TorA maturation chaperone TorD
MNPVTGSSWEAPAKADLCALLSRLFASELNIELYHRLRASLTPTFSWFEPALLELPEAETLERLAVEYCRLFVGPQALCPPYASAQRGEAMLGGRARTDLEAFMAANSVPVTAAAWRIASPDHIAVELGVLAYCYAENFSTAVMREFLRHHLLPWAPSFLADVQSCARYRLYDMAARLALAFLHEEESDVG